MIESKTMRVNRKGDLVYLTFPLFERYGVKHAFTTRHGGVSEGDCASFNTSFDRGEPRENVLENLRILCDAIGINRDSITYSKQTHTNNVRVITADDIGKGVIKPVDYTDVDGLISNIAGSALLTQYADCVPLAFYDTKNKIIATSHAGWRGTVKEIGRVTVERMKSEFGSNAADIIAGIGPAVGSCCYEVDDPVYTEFSKMEYLDMDEIFVKKSNGKYMLDLKKANKLILMKAGLREENIDVADLCTNCLHEHLHSHRYTGGRRGNLGMLIAL
ncbi:MAG: peptidoglycan editing factor PgeF [Clostridia bacterium]|nr:peptidoglycan editing factor PgeF [Clostridia bacterium]MBR3594601.1 peptidoglycan editing factor PgeF [Clostridia bacterium]